MIKRELIRKTEEFLRQRFDAAIYLNQHPDAKAYRIEHTYRVANIGRQIALREGFDVYRIHETLAGDRGGGGIVAGAARVLYRVLRKTFRTDNKQHKYY